MLKDYPNPDKIREARRRIPAHQPGFCEAMPGSEILKFLVVRKVRMVFHLKRNRQARFRLQDEVNFVFTLLRNVRLLPKTPELVMDRVFRKGVFAQSRQDSGNAIIAEIKFPAKRRGFIPARIRRNPTNDLFHFEKVQVLQDGKARDTHHGFQLGDIQLVAVPQSEQAHQLLKFPDLLKVRHGTHIDIDVGRKNVFQQLAARSGTRLKDDIRQPAAQQILFVLAFQPFEFIRVKAHVRKTGPALVNHAAEIQEFTEGQRKQLEDDLASRQRLAEVILEIERTGAGQQEFDGIGVMQIFDHARQVRHVLDFIQCHGHGLADIQPPVAQEIQHQVIVAFLKHSALVEPLQVQIDLIHRGDLFKQPAQGSGFSRAAHPGNDDGALVVQCFMKCRKEQARKGIHACILQKYTFIVKYHFTKNTYIY